MENTYKTQIILFSEFIPDLTRYLSWIGDPDSNPYISGARKGYSIVELQSYIEEKSTSVDVRFWGIYTKSLEHIGTIKLEPIDLGEKTAWLGVLIGESDLRGRGYGQDAVIQVIAYSRDVLRLEKIFLGVDVRNSSAFALYRKLGFLEVKRENFSITMTLMLN